MEAWKRRGQSRAALGQDAEAILDLTRAAELAPNDSDVLHQRGLVYFKLVGHHVPMDHTDGTTHGSPLQRNFLRARDDFKRATTLDPTGKLSWNHFGLCLNALGRPLEAIAAHKRALELDSSFREAIANIGQAHKDYGNSRMYSSHLIRASTTICSSSGAVKAEKYFAKSLKIDSNYVHAFHLRGLARFGAGDHRYLLVWQLPLSRLYSLTLFFLSSKRSIG